MLHQFNYIVIISVFAKQVLCTNIRDFRNFADHLESVRDTGSIAAVSNAEAFKKANEELGGILLSYNGF